MILRYATPFPGESDGAAPLLHMARARYVGYAGRPREGRGSEKERGLIIISSPGVPEHPRRATSTHVRTQPASHSRSWEQRDLFVRMVKKKKERETEREREREREGDCAEGESTQPESNRCSERELARSQLAERRIIHRRGYETDFGLDSYFLSLQLPSSFYHETISCGESINSDTA